MTEIKLKWPEGVPESEFSKEFLQGMLDRMAMSYYKYGALAKAFPDKYDAISSSRDRIKKYIETKNTEFLIDSANFCMIEFLAPRMAGAFFTPTTDEDSPGLVNRETGMRDRNPNE